MGTPPCSFSISKSSAPSRAFPCMSHALPYPLNHTKRYGGVSKGSKTLRGKKRVREQFSKIGFFWITSSPFALLLERRKGVDPLVLLSSATHFDDVVLCTDGIHLDPQLKVGQTQYLDCIEISIQSYYGVIVRSYG